MTKSNLIVSAK